MNGDNREDLREEGAQEIGGGGGLQDTRDLIKILKASIKLINERNLWLRKRELDRDG